PAAPRSGRLRLAYEVRLNGADASTQLVVPTVPLAADGEHGDGVVRLTVTFVGGWHGARVLLPRLDPAGDGSGWSGRLLAIPSLVRVRAAGAAAPRCAAAAMPGE